MLYDYLPAFVEPPPFRGVLSRTEVSSMTFVFSRNELWATREGIPAGPAAAPARSAAGAAG
jgi:hypothetical protein